MQPGSACLSRRYFTVPRPLLQSIVATSGTTPPVFPRGSSINVAAQLTSLTSSAPALARHSQLVGQLQQFAKLQACVFHKATCTKLYMPRGKRNRRHVDAVSGLVSTPEAVWACAAEQTIAMINPGFSTHNVQMSQRYVVLSSTCPMPTARAGAPLC